jgi:hypothetical protein
MIDPWQGYQLIAESIFQNISFQKNTVSLIKNSPASLREAGLSAFDSCYFNHCST